MLRCNWRAVDEAPHRAALTSFSLPSREWPAEELVAALLNTLHLDKERSSGAPCKATWESMTGTRHFTVASGDVRYAVGSCVSAKTWVSSLTHVLYLHFLFLVGAAGSSMEILTFVAPQPPHLWTQTLWMTRVEALPRRCLSIRMVRSVGVNLHGEPAQKQRLSWSQSRA